MGVFDNVQFTKYTPTYVGAPVEQFIQTATALNQRYEQAIENKDRITSMLANTTVASVNQFHLNNIANGINTDLREFIDKGNWEDAGLAIKSTVQKNLAGNPLYKGIVTDYANRQVFKKQMDDGVTSKIYSRSWADRSMAMQLELIGGKAVATGPNGELTNVFQGIAPPEEISIPELELKIGKEVQDATTIGQLSAHPQLQGHWQQLTSTRKDPGVIKSLIKNYILNDPKVKDSLDYKAQLDYFSTHYTKSKDPVTGEMVGSYTPVTAQELISMGANIVTQDDVDAENKKNPLAYLNSKLQGRLQVGDIREALGPVPELDSNSHATGKTIMAYGTPITNINSAKSNLLGYLWKEFNKIRTTDAPLPSIIEALSQSKLTINDVKDDYWFMQQEHAFKLEQDKKNRIPLLSTPIEMGENGDLLTLDAIQQKKQEYTGAYMTELRNEIASYRIPGKDGTPSEIPMAKEDQNRLFYMLSNGWKSDDIRANYRVNKGNTGWTDMGYIIQKIKERDQRKMEFDRVNSMDKGLKNAIGLTDAGDKELQGKADQIYQYYLKTGSLSNGSVDKSTIITIDNTANKLGIEKERTSINLWNPLQVLDLSRLPKLETKQSVMRQAIYQGLLSNAGYLDKYNAELKKYSSQTQVRTFMNFGNMTPDQNKAMVTGLQELLYNNINSTGQLDVREAKTGKSVDMTNFLNGEYKDIRWEIINGQTVLAIKPTLSKDKASGTFKQGDYLIVRNITGVESFLSQFSEMGQLMYYKNLTSDLMANKGVFKQAFPASPKDDAETRLNKSRTTIKAFASDAAEYSVATLPSYQINVTDKTGHTEVYVYSSDAELYDALDDISNK